VFVVRVRQIVRGVLGAILLVGGVVLVVRPEQGPWSVLASLALAGEPLVRAWRGARGTALRSALVWAAIALGLGVVSQGAALTETLGSGRPAAGHCTYCVALAALAALISVLNARSPGGGAWAVLTALLVLVFLIPWLEGPGLGRSPDALARLRLDSPWTIFYGLLVLAGVTNYLPTRYGPPALLLAAGFVLEYAGLVRWVASPRGLAALWSAVPWTLAAAVWLADLRGENVPSASGPTEAVWFWFRDHWGAVWGLRILERFNRTAEAQRWPFRLSWHGFVPSPGERGQREMVVEDGAAGATLAMLLRRFADPARVERAGSAPLASGRALSDDA
jgi:hypothetical protein